MVASAMLPACGEGSTLCAHCLDTMQAFPELAASFLPGPPCTAQLLAMTLPSASLW